MGRTLNSPLCQKVHLVISGEVWDVSCALEERQFGQDICMNFTNGAFYDNQFQHSVENPETLDFNRCVECRLPLWRIMEHIPTMRL
jgi:hypothetical protein